MRATTSFVSIVLALACVAYAQAPTPGQRTPAAPQMPPRATPSRDRPATGTAILRGVVVAAETGKPISRARVSVSVAGPGRAAQTDAEGRFEITGVPAGKHIVNAMKAGYVSNLLPGRRIDPIEVADGQTVDKIVIALSKGGVIAGQVLDDSGEPMIGANVRALRYRYVDGRRQLTPSYGGGGGGGGQTDDLGTFRLYGLEPGEYYVSATGGRDFMPFGGAAPNADGPAQTFYPGTTNPSEARRVTVRAGRETNGVIFPVVVMRLSRIAGRVQTSSGVPFTGSVGVSRRDDIVGGFGSFGSGVRPDGGFEVGNLQAGAYVLMTRPEFGPNGERDSALVGRMEVTVNGDDINDLVLFVGEGGGARGRLITDEGGALPPSSGSLRISAMSADRDVPFIGPPRMGVIKPDGTFELTGLLGLMHLRPDSPAPPEPSGARWLFKSVLLDGRDVTDAGIDFQTARVVESIDIVFTRKITQLSGELRDDRRNVPEEAWVVIFPADESRWLPRSRLIRATRVDKTGAYRMPVTPYDDYLVVGVIGIEEGQWADPDFLRAAKEAADRFSIADGETKVQNLKLAEWRK
jgi:Carboxypeptidase regulatory-like domain